jgi:hypothetical protein
MIRSSYRGSSIVLDGGVGTNVAALVIARFSAVPKASAQCVAAVSIARSLWRNSYSDLHCDLIFFKVEYELINLAKRPILSYGIFSEEITIVVKIEIRVPRIGQNELIYFRQSHSEGSLRCRRKF